MTQIEIEHERETLKNLQQAADILYECSDSTLLNELNNDVEELHERAMEIASILFERLKKEEIKIYNTVRR